MIYESYNELLARVGSIYKMVTLASKLSLKIKKGEVAPSCDITRCRKTTTQGIMEIIGDKYTSEEV